MQIGFYYQIIASDIDKNSWHEQKSNKIIQWKD